MAHEGSVTDVRQRAVVLFRDAQVLLECIAMIGHPLTVKAAAVVGTKMGRQSNPPARRIASSDGFPGDTHPSRAGFGECTSLQTR